MLTYSIVIPVYRSAPILPELYQRLSAVMQGLGKPYEIIFVDDCGPDNAWQVLEGLANKDSSVSAIQLMRNSGQSNATLCGLAHARGETLITMDDDLQHPPEEIPALVSALEANVDVVMGVPKEKNHHWFRLLGSSAMHSINSYLLGKSRNLRFTSFRLMRRSVVDGVLALRTLSPALGPMIYSVSHRIINVTVQHAPRRVGRSSYSFRHILSQSMGNLIGYSMLPLRLLAILGAAGILISIVLAIVLVVHYLQGGVVPGWTSIALLLVMLSGFNFFAFAILGEYMIRILRRVNATPQYFVRRRVSSSNEGPRQHAV
jgi:polyisoprenyl-phosphate glycosyltransferase